MDYTLGRTVFIDAYHIDVIKEKLMRTLPAVVPDVVDELFVAIPDCIPATGDGERHLASAWTPIDETSGAA